MWYILNMNKDVIYIEPDDDITDIISKLESAKEQIVALVPPKKSGVLRSVVNIKLITKASAANKKKLVIVTTDPSIVKLAAASKIPVTKNLQTAPAIPSEEDLEEEVISEEVEDDEVKVTDGTAVEPEENEDEDGDEEESEEESEEKTEEADDEKDEEKKDDDPKIDEKAAMAAIKDIKSENKKKEKEEKEAAKKEKKEIKNPALAWIVNYKKWVIAGAAATVLIVLFLIWALVIAPAVKITVAVRTDSNNFSELVSFTSDPAAENTYEGIFYLEEVKIEEEQKADFTATGSKNVGEKAHGSIIVQIGFRFNEINKPVNINAGSAFKASGLTFYSDSDVSLSWNGNSGECESSFLGNGCIRSAKVSVTAAAPGEVYNIDKTSFTAPSDRVTAYSEAAFSGGTDKNVTIVTSENVEAARTIMSNNIKEKEEEYKNNLYAKIGEGKLAIDSSYKQKLSELTSSPNVDEEVSETVVPSATATVSFSIYAIDKTKLEEFITKKAKLAEDQKIYEISNPFIESFVSTESGYTGKLKTSYKTGPKVTENDIIELVKGKGIGDIKHDLGSVNGLTIKSIDTSYPWVTSAPNDSNRITIVLEIEGQNNPNSEE